MEFRTLQVRIELVEKLGAVTQGFAEHPHEVGPVNFRPEVREFQRLFGLGRIERADEENGLLDKNVFKVVEGTDVSPPRDGYFEAADAAEVCHDSK